MKRNATPDARCAPGYPRSMPRTLRPWWRRCVLTAPLLLAIAPVAQEELLTGRLRAASALAAPPRSPGLPNPPPPPPPATPGSAKGTPKGKPAKPDAEPSEYLSCGCGCCGGAQPQKVCLYRKKGDKLKRIIEQDESQRSAPMCAMAGCSLGTLYRYCD